MALWVPWTQASSRSLLQVTMGLAPSNFPSILSRRAVLTAQHFVILWGMAALVASPPLFPEFETRWPLHPSPTSEPRQTGPLKSRHQRILRLSWVVQDSG